MKNPEITSLKPEYFDQLRKQAEHLLGSKGFVPDGQGMVETQKIFQELQVRQMELEMQNDELNLVAFELENERAKFSSLFGLAPVGYVVLNRKGIIVDINQAGNRLFGLRKKMLVNKALSGFVFADDAPKFSNFFSKILAETSEESCQVRLFKMHESAFYADLRGVCISNANVSDCYITIIDISEKMRAGQELERVRQRLNAALSASLTGIWEIKLPSGEIYLDDFSKSIFGVQYSFDGRYSSLMALIGDADREIVDSAIRTTLVRDNDFDMAFSICTPAGGHKYIHARGRLMHDDGESRYLGGTITDITEKRSLELEASRLKEQQRQEVRAASLQAEENARRSISESLHDSVGQMLYAMKMNLEQLKDDVGADPHYKQAVQLLDQSIRDVRNLSFELAPSILRDFGLSATVEEMARRLSNDSLSVRVHGGQIGRMEMNTMVNIYRVIQELVNNSIKHGEATEISIEISKRKNFIYIDVKDNGKGFPAGKRSPVVSGAGLSSIRNRITLYHGSMDIETAPGKGTNVYIRLKQ